MLISCESIAVKAKVCQRTDARAWSVVVKLLLGEVELAGFHFSSRKPDTQPCGGLQYEGRVGGVLIKIPHPFQTLYY
jgi:hypothetical protein